jgi:hypothetical protein
MKVMTKIELSNGREADGPPTNPVTEWDVVIGEFPYRVKIGRAITWRDHGTTVRFFYKDAGDVDRMKDFDTVHALIKSLSEGEKP